MTSYTTSSRGIATITKGKGDCYQLKQQCSEVPNTSGIVCLHNATKVAEADSSLV